MPLASPVGEVSSEGTQGSHSNAKPISRLPITGLDVHAMFLELATASLERIIRRGSVVPLYGLAISAIVSFGRSSRAYTNSLPSYHLY